jgi:hypothetical protein
MHQQPGDRGCNNEAIGGAHWGPVQVYLSKVSDATTADGNSASWFKIFSNSWAKKSGGRVGDDDEWGTRDLSACCGRMDVKIPSDIASGDYLLRAEALALHAASPGGGAQFYMSCYQISVAGGGSASPATVKFPGAYSASDPGIGVNIHGALSQYIAPGPAVYSGGTTKRPGSGCVGCENTCKVGSSPTAVAPSSGGGGGGADGGGAATDPSACTVAAYGQCGGNTYSGCTKCAVSLSHVRCEVAVLADEDAVTVWLDLQGRFPAVLLAVLLETAGRTSGGRARGMGKSEYWAWNCRKAEIVCIAFISKSTRSFNLEPPMSVARCCVMLA